MKCHACGGSMKEKGERYHYTECGLDNVYLENISVYTCNKCSDEFVEIPQPVQLHIMLAIVISQKPAPLNGQEIRFLRKEVGMTGKAYAEMLGVNPVTLSKWENNNLNRESSSDRAIRMAFKLMMSEKLRTLITCLEAQIKKSEVVSIHNKTMDVDTDAMKYVEIPAPVDVSC